MVKMIKLPKRSPKEKLEILKGLARNAKYGFELVGKKVPVLPLEELGVEGLNKYYHEQAEEYSLNSKKPYLQDYCCLFTYKLRKFSEGHTKYLNQEDVRYAMETVVALDALVSQKIGSIGGSPSGKSGNQQDVEDLENICSEVAGYVRAISTLSSTDFEPCSKKNNNEELKEEAERIIALYREAGAIRKR
ncbi:MAG: hypothetical protein ABIG84_04375 [archaeon]